MTTTSTEPLPTQIESGVVTVTLEQPGRPVVVLDLDLIRRLVATLKAVPQTAAGLILRSASERVFVAGADLNQIQDAGDEQLHQYLQLGARAFGMLCDLPYPTVAAINGAALGGGLELAMHCDALIASIPASKPYPVGLPEAGLGLCPGWGGTSMLPSRIDPAEAIKRTATGKTFLYEEARDAGLFVNIQPEQGGLIEACRAWLAEAKAPPRDSRPSHCIARKPAVALRALEEVESDLPDTPAARAVATCVRVGGESGWEQAIETERRELVGLRHTDEAKAALEAFFAKQRG
ncbi:MAG: enoyl-CoA hydratase/isomerase family protein [Planctomycetota bacterium]